jgi:hypothetical protein
LEGAVGDRGFVQDVITAANDQPVHSMSDLANILEEIGVGNTVKLTVARDGQSRTVNVTVGDTSRQAPGWATGRSQPISTKSAQEEEHDATVLLRTTRRLLLALRVHQLAGLELASTQIPLDQKAARWRGVVVAAAREQPHSLAVPAQDQPMAVVLDFVHPGLAAGAGIQGSTKPSARMRAGMAWE